MTQTPPQDSVSDVERQLREPSWVRSLAFDDAAAECRRIATTFVHTDEVSQDEAKGFRIGCETAAAMLRMLAVRQAPDDLAVPINKIGEDAKVSDSSVYKHTFYGILNAQGDFWTPLAFESEQAATDHITRFWGGAHTDKAKQCLGTHSIVPVRIQLSAIRRLSTNTDKGVR